MKQKLKEIIDINTEGNYLLSSSDKAQMVFEILDLFDVELKKAIIGLKKKEDLIEAKKGDFLTLKTNPSKVVIFEARAGVYGGFETFTIIYDLPIYINGIPAYTVKGVKMPISRFRHSTEEEKATMIEEMKKLGKRYNPETFKVEDIEKDMSPIKTFKDLEFVKHPILLYTKPSKHIEEMVAKSKHAVMEFENGYGVSVQFGDIFYSNGIDTYEVAIMKDNHICLDTPLTDTVLRYKNENEVTEIMRKVQEFK